MQTSLLGELAFNVKDRLMFIYKYVDLNTIGNEGCAFLNKTFWPSLKSLNLARNKIGHIGLSFLVGAKW